MRSARLTQVIVFCLLIHFQHLRHSFLCVQIHGCFLGVYEGKPDFLAGSPETGHHLAGEEGLVLLALAEGFCDVDVLYMEREIVGGFRDGREDVGESFEGFCLVHVVAVVRLVASWVMPIAMVCATSTTPTRRSPANISFSLPTGPHGYQVHRTAEEKFA